MQTCDPLNARLWFGLRKLVNWAITIAFLLLSYWLLTFIFDWWLAAIIAVSGAACLFFLVLEDRVIGIICPNPKCKRYIETDTPWLCSFGLTLPQKKECVNLHTDRFPFINKCETCGNKPKAYQCHHCGKLVFLSKDKEKEQFAKRHVAPEEPLTGLTFNQEMRKDVPDDKLAQEQAQRDQEIRSLKHQLEVTNLKENIKIAEKKSSVKLEPISTESDLRIARIRRVISEKGDLTKLRAQLIKEAEAQYAQDSDELRDAINDINETILTAKERFDREHSNQ
jgi:hypothetical protein